MSNQEKEVLAGLCRIEIKRWRKARDKQYMVDLMQLAFSELTEGWQQRAEKAEAQLQAERETSDIIMESLRQKEAQLAALAKQKAVGTVSIAMDWNTHRNIATVNMRPDLVVSEMKDGDELFTRPAPPARVVPEEMPKGLAGTIVSLIAHNIGDKLLAQKIWNACRAEMLRMNKAPEME